MPSPWLCPNDPPCPHSGLFHDVLEFDGDAPTCCVEGCDCAGEPLDGFTEEEAEALMTDRPPPVPWSSFDVWSPYCSCVLRGPMLTGPTMRYPDPACPVHEATDPGGR